LRWETIRPSDSARLWPILRNINAGAEIDAHEGDAEQDKDRMRHIGFEQRTERRHRDADEHQRRKGTRALAADPAQHMDGRRDGCLQRWGHSASGGEATSRREISKWRYRRDDAASGDRRKVTSRSGVLPLFSAFDALNRYPAVRPPSTV
jgi:hypothetical protein